MDLGEQQQDDDDEHWQQRILAAPGVHRLRLVINILNMFLEPVVIERASERTKASARRMTARVR